MLLQQLVNGLTLGAVYTLIALSFSLVMGILGILNLAIAELFMIGGYLGFAAITAQSAAADRAAVGMAGARCPRVVIEKDRLPAAARYAGGHADAEHARLLDHSAERRHQCLGLRSAAAVRRGPRRAIRSRTGQHRAMQLVVLGATIVLVALLAFVVQRTSIGRALRAVAENRDVARLLGVSADRVDAVRFRPVGRAGRRCRRADRLHYAAITPYVGVEIGLKAIAVMVVGGTTRIWGALIAGPLIGIVEVLTVAYGGSQIRDFVVYGFMILVLLLRPQGILGGARADQGQRV